VKEGPKLSQLLLNAGGNDFMGTLMNESILLPCMTARARLRRSSATPAPPASERRRTNRRSSAPKKTDHYDPLDLIEGEAEERFGSYARLTHSPDYRFRGPDRDPAHSPEVAGARLLRHLWRPRRAGK